MSVKTENFINRIAPMAVEDMKQTRVLASLTIAQAILESGWGESKLAREGNNLFGIKKGSAWEGQTIVLNSLEWRSYNSWEESILDHSNLLQKDRYSKVIATNDYRVACEEVRIAGYCTEADYSQKVIRLIEQYDLAQFDLIGEVGEVSKEEIENEVEQFQELYRVRLNWEDSKSQIGAYYDLSNAKKKASENDGYKVFNSKGELVYPISYLIRIIDRNVPVYKDVEGAEVVCFVNKGDVFTIVETKQNHLKLKSGVGWLLDNPLEIEEVNSYA